MTFLLDVHEHPLVATSRPLLTASFESAHWPYFLFRISFAMNNSVWSFSLSNFSNCASLITFSIFDKDQCNKTVLVFCTGTAHLSSLLRLGMCMQALFGFLCVLCFFLLRNVIIIMLEKLVQPSRADIIYSIINLLTLLLINHPDILRSNLKDVWVCEGHVATMDS